MSEMVERVAKALSIVDGNHPDACSNDEEEIPAWKLYVKDARAAIEAMREPTEAMLNEAVGALDSHNVGSHEANIVWQAMIDEALK
jgi:hypothetical protein